MFTIVYVAFDVMMGAKVEVHFHIHMELNNDLAVRPPGKSPPCKILVLVVLVTGP